MAKGHKQQRGPNTWRLYVNEPAAGGRRRQRTRTFHGTPVQADRALARFVKEAQRGAIGDTRALTVGQLVEKWFTHNEDSWEPNTSRGYRSKIDNHITARIGHLPLQRVGPEDLDGLYRDLRADGLGPQSIRHVHRILHAAFAQAVRWRYIYDNPATDARPPATGPSEPKDLKDATVNEALASASWELRLAARLAATTGAREGEVCGLRWTDLDERARVLKIRRRAVRHNGETIMRPMTKNRTARAVGLDRRTVATLRLHHYRARRRATTCGLTLDDDAFVLSETPDGAPLSPSVLSQRWSRHTDALTFHELRHFHVSVLRDDNAPLGRVSRRVGHSRESTTSDIYTHDLRATDHDLADIAAKHLD